MSRASTPPAADPPDAGAVPPFVPHPWLRGPHAQTIFARLWPWPRARLASTYAEVDAGGGDFLSVLDSLPPGWKPGDPAALLVHGLGGCARSPYMVRVGRRLVGRLGIRVVRMNLRGAGSGFGRSRSYYHSGKTEDVRRVAAWLARRAPGSPITLIGFSLGANLVLKLAGEAAEAPVDQLVGVVAANPPVDLEASCRAIQDPRNRIYDRNFVRLLRAEVSRLHARFPDLDPIDLTAAHSLLAFDEAYTAPRNGFRHARDYYQQSSAGPWIERIRVPGLVVHARDDPFIPPAALDSISFPPSVRCEMIPQGGHLGFWSHRPWDGDRRWLDARIVHWLARQHPTASPPHIPARPPSQVIDPNHPPGSSPPCRAEPSRTSTEPPSTS